jgi:hypothetical protein
MLQSSRCLGLAGLTELALMLGTLAAPAARGVNVNFNMTINDADLGMVVQGDFTMWLPDDVSRPRGLIYILPGSGGNSQSSAIAPYYQQQARALGFGVVGYGVHGAVTPNFRWDRDLTSLQRSLDAAAAASGHPELSNAPVALTGASAGGYYSFALSKANPTRVIAAAYGWQGTNNLADDSITCASAHAHDGWQQRHR